MRRIIAITVLVIMASMASAHPLKMVKKEKRVKPVMTIRGTVSDAAGPLMDASILEVDENNRPLGNYTVTDVNGHFTLGVMNKRHKIRVGYIGLETATLKITKKKYHIVLKPKKYAIDIDPFKGIGDKEGVTEEPRWRTIPLESNEAVK